MGRLKTVYGTCLYKTLLGICLALAFLQKLSLCQGLAYRQFVWECDPGQQACGTGSIKKERRKIQCKDAWSRQPASPMEDTYFTPPESSEAPSARYLRGTHPGAKGGACIHSGSRTNGWLWVGHQHLCHGFASPFPAERRSYTSVEELLSLSSLNHFSLLFLEAVGVTVVLEAIFTFLS